MRQSLLTDKKCGKEYKTPRAHLTDLEPESVVCDSFASTEDYDILDSWDIADNDLTY